jgi:protein tyrosine phosphatase
VPSLESCSLHAAQADDSDLVRWSYVATQGPMTATTEDFWNMVVEQNCGVIVMLTRVREGGTEKCTQYFPEHTGEVLEVSLCARV